MKVNTKTRRNWSYEETEFLKTHYLKLSLLDIAKTLKRSYSSVKGRAKILNLYSQAINNIKPLQNLSKVEKAYIAGFVDGEGSINVIVEYRNKVPARVRPDVQIVNADKNVIEWISSKINYGKWKSSVLRTYIKKGYKPSYSLQIAARLRVEPFLLAILPYLRVKKNLAKKVFKLYQLRKTQKPYSIHELELALEIKKLINSTTPAGRLSRRILSQYIKKFKQKNLKFSN